MANRTINSNQLAPGTSFMVRGRLSFSRITSLIEGDELAKRKESAVKNGQTPIDRPHTTASIYNAQVVYDNPDAVNNPALRTPAEIYANESMYVSKKNPQNGNCFTGVNKGNQLPSVGVLQSDQKTVQGIIPEHELAKDLDVTFVMRVYKPKTQMNHGVSLEAIIVNEPIRYYENSNIASSLEEKGIIWKQPVQVPTLKTDAQAPVPTENMNQSVATPVAPPQGNPYSNAQPQPQQQVPFMNQPQNQQPVPQNNGYAPNPNGYNGSENMGRGIRYEPTDRQY